MTHGAPPPVLNFISDVGWPAWFGLTVSLLLILAGWRYRSSWRHPWSGYLLATAGRGSLFLLFAASWLRTPIYIPGRVDTIALPAFILLLASGVQAFPQRWRCFHRYRQMVDDAGVLPSAIRQEIAPRGLSGAREEHPNWLDWSVYEDEKLAIDAAEVAARAARIAAAEHSTVWMLPGERTAGITDLLGPCRNN